jgi:hypothetical protein
LDSCERPNHASASAENKRKIMILETLESLKRYSYKGGSDNKGNEACYRAQRVIPHRVKDNGEKIL